MRSNDDAVESQEILFQMNKVTYHIRYCAFGFRCLGIGQSLRVKTRDFETLGTLCAASACRIIGWDP